MDIVFNSEAELYERLKPALKARTSELFRLGIIYIKEEDIWNFLKEKKWKNSKALSLNDMVNSIMNLKEYEIENYVKDILKKNKTVANIEGDDYYEN